MAQVASLIRRLIRKVFPPPIDITDEYIGRLFCAIAGMVERGNLHAYNHAFQRIPKETAVIEIGSYAGQSMNAMLYYLEQNSCQNPVFSCDIWEYSGALDSNPPSPEYLLGVGSRNDLSRSHYMSFIKDSFIRNTLKFNPGALPGTLHLTSDDFFDKWASNQEVEDVFGNRQTLGGPIGFCFIDGHQDYEFTLRDWENTDRFLVSGGYVLLDDSADRWKSGRRKVAGEILKNRDYELVFKNPNYMFRKK